MIGLQLGAERQLSVLCLGAHSDDIEIGAGGTLLTLLGHEHELHVSWCVLSGSESRRAEAEASARDFLHGAASQRVQLLQFQDGFFPAQICEIKTWFEQLKESVKPDLILTHRRDDLHQDHREVSRHTWNTFRDHLILEYEIPKWDGDLGQPNLYVPLTKAVLQRKIELLTVHFGTQRAKDWFDPNVFHGLARLRGMECRAPQYVAEAFFARKIVMG
jgi:LmbE family N-acetylglucosaminyl deacetylase